MPFVLSQVVVGLVFSWFFHTRFGLLNEILGALGMAPVAPLDSEHWSHLHDDRRRPVAADRLLHDPLPDGPCDIAARSSPTPRGSTARDGGR